MFCAIAQTVCLVTDSARLWCDQLVPGLFKPEMVLSTDAHYSSTYSTRQLVWSQRVAEFSRIVAPVDEPHPVRFLQKLEPSIVELNGALTALIPRFSNVAVAQLVAVVSKLKYSNSSLGELAVYADVFSAAQLRSDWFFRHTLRPHNQELIPFVWEEILKALVIARNAAALTVGDLDKAHRLLCESILVPNAASVRSQWSDICTYSGFDRVPEILTFEELYFYLKALAASKAGTHVSYGRMGGEVLLELARNSPRNASESSPSIGNPEIRNIPLALDPMAKYLCMVRSIPEMCTKLLSRFQALGLPGDGISGLIANRLRGVDMDERKLAYYVPVGAGLELGLDEASELSSELEALGGKGAVALLQILAWIGAKWPGFERLVSLESEGSTNLEVTVATNGAGSRLGETVHRLCARFPALRKCANVKQTLMQVSARELLSEDRGLDAPGNLVSFAIRILEIPACSEETLETRIRQGQALTENKADASCGICLEDFSDTEPGKLPLLFCDEGAHVICVTCTRSLVTRNGDSPAFVCPVCRRPVLLVSFTCVRNCKYSYNICNNNCL